MAPDIDPYFHWLGIPIDQQPPDHYRLLGIGRFEESYEAIGTAAAKQMKLLRAQQSGEHASLAKQLLLDVVAARACLLDARAKAEYDRLLRQELGIETAPSALGARSRPAGAAREFSVASLEPGADGAPAAVVGLPGDGDRLAEYQLLEKLGQGGMGAVYKGVHTAMDRVVAVKVLPPGLLQDERAVARFKREIKAIAQLKHPNIVEAYDAREIDGLRFLVMEYVEGVDLNTLVKRTGPLPVPEACELARQTALGLQCAQERGLVHRDIKPSNVMVTTRGGVKILDLGLARVQEDQSQLDEVTGTGHAVGTVEYMAPEQIADSHAVDIRADIYSLGCMLYRLLAGRPPFSGSRYDTVIKKLMGHTNDRADPIGTLREDVPPGLALLIEQMMAKSPDTRPATPAEVASALAGFCAGADVAALAAQGPTGPAASSGSGAALVTAAGRCGEETPLSPNVPPASSSSRRVTPVAPPVAQPTGREGRSANPRPLYVAAGAGAILALVAAGAFLAIWLTRDVGTSEQRPVAHKVGGLEKPREREKPRPAANPTGTSKPPRVEPPKPEPADTKPWPKVPPAEEPPEASPPGPHSDEKPGDPVPPQPQAEPSPPAEDPQESRYARSLKPVEELVARWDFAGAATALTRVLFSEPPLAARLAARAGDIRRMAGLKARIIDKINAAQPPMTKIALMIRGASGDVVEADERGIATRLTDGKTEQLAWTELGDMASERLLRLVVDPQRGDDCLAAAVLAQGVGNVPVAERYYRKAQALGVDVDAYLPPLAEAELAEARLLLEAREFVKAKAVVAEMRKKYAAISWLAERRDDVDAAWASAERGITEADAERLFAQAAGHFERHEPFLLRPLVDRLTSQFPDSAAVTDATRKPSFADMSRAVANLGKWFTVRLDGRGDFRTIQAAIDAAALPNSVIEIQDNGPYDQELNIDDKKVGLTLRGMKGAWPVLTSNRKGNSGSVMRVAGPRATLERLVLAHARPNPNAISLQGHNKERLTVRSSIIATGAGSAVGGQCDLDTCVVVGPSDPYGAYGVKNSIWLGPPLQSARNELTCANSLFLGRVDISSPAEFRACTLVGGLNVRGQPNTIVDSIAASIEAASADTRIERSDVFGSPAYRDAAKPDNGCFSEPPQFVDPKALDFRLRNASPCRGRASDGGDVGCRMSPQMLEVLKLAQELRARGAISF